MNKIILSSFILLVCLLSLSLTLASFSYQKHEIQKNYRYGENIRGTINLTLDKEPASSLFTSDFKDNITLIELIKRNKLTEGKDFECNSKGCIDIYLAESALNELEINKEKTVGLKIVGNEIEEISLLKFNIESTLSQSCENPLKLTLFGKDELVLTGNKYKDVSCSSNKYGCFDFNLNEYSSAIIEDIPLCETISLSQAPAYRIGAKITNSTKGNGQLSMTMYNNEGTMVACTLPAHSLPEQELDCIVNYIPTKNNYTVCVENKDYEGLDSQNYKIRYESSSNICGNLNRDFEVFARSLQYDQTSVLVNSSSIEELYSLSLEAEAFEYLQDNYALNQDESVLCNPYCILPVKLLGPSQTIKISEVDLIFRDGGLTVDENAYKKIYELSISPALVSSKSIKLDLAPANFIVPYENKTLFNLFLNKKFLFQENITVSESFDFLLATRFAFIALPTSFIIDSQYNITHSTWDFGDGTTETIKGVKAIHSYFENKTYTIKVEATRKDGVIAVRNFEVLVGNPKESANRTISEYKRRLSNITKQMDIFPLSIKEPLIKTLDISVLNNSLSQIEKKFKNSSSDKEYVEVIEDLLDLKIPNLITISKQGKFPLEVGFSNINTVYLEEVSGEEVEDSQQLKQKIIQWIDDNYGASFSFYTLSSYFNKEKEDILTKYTLKITPLKEETDTSFLFIDYPFESINFQKNYNQKKVGEGAGAYIPLSGETTEIEFFIDRDVNVEELGAYISPQINSLVLDEVDKPTCLPEDKDCQLPYPWKRLLFWLGSLFVMMIVIYLIVQEWYKKHYEHHLFKNKQDLYNLINFIYNSRVTGLDDSTIKKKLRANKWDNEKITYTFNKINGKRTGMWEIPIFKSFENRVVKKEIAKRQGQPVNTNFIKRSGF